MSNLLSFRGPAGRARYLTWSLAAWAIQPLVVALAFGIGGQSFSPDWGFWLLPLHRLFELRGVGAVSMTLIMASSLIASAISVWLALRRATSARVDAWIAALAITPLLQGPVALWLTFAPDRQASATAVAQTIPPGGKSIPAIQGVVAGAGLTVASVALGTLVFGEYGFGLFVASPFLVGAIAAFLANRRADIGLGGTLATVAWALVLAGAMILSVALEGVVCLVLAAPLAAVPAFLGAWLGHALATKGQGSTKGAMMSVALLPGLFTTEHAFPSPTRFESEESIVVAASPDATWQALVNMGAISTPPSLPFRLGLAYPVRGEILGQGVGAIRRGVFSTGVAYERVTEWSPGRKLAFAILSDAPSLHELSPYRRVYAPHVNGYFKTKEAVFTIMPLAGGRSRLSLITSHELDLEPALYWAPFAEWVVHANKVRVLEHFRRRAESAATKATAKDSEVRAPRTA